MSQIVINLELYEGKDIISGKDHVREYGTTTSTTLCLTQPYHCSATCIIPDSRFGSVKSASELMRQGLYSTMLVKTAHKDFHSQLLGEEPLQHGEWKAYTTNKHEVKLQACRFCDLKIKDFISTCSSVIPGLPRKTKHHGKVAQPKDAEDLRYAVAIDIHNHYRNGSAGLEDVWLTKSPHKWQLVGILGFCFTNGFLAMKYFGKKQPAILPVQHNSFNSTYIV